MPRQAMAPLPARIVASEAVAEAVRRDGRLFLRLDDGTELPVSRSYVSDVREAGLA